MNDILQFVVPMIPTLRRYANGLMGDKDVADDVVQDCLERVVAHWHKRRNDDPRTWVFTILHNVAISNLRKNVRRGPHLHLDDVHQSKLSRQPSQEDSLLQKSIFDAIGQLPEEQRSVLLLVSMEDMSYSQVADVLQIPLGTVMSRLSRARERLRQIMDQPSKSNMRTGTQLRRVK